MKKNAFLSIFATLSAGFAFPLVASAQSGGINVGIIQGYSTSFINIINNIFIPLLFAVALLVFIYGVYKYFILGGADGKAREEGRSFVLWGVVGFTVIISVWGLVNVLMSIFNLDSGNVPPAPTINFGSGNTTPPPHIGPPS